MTKKYAICNVHLVWGEIKPMFMSYEDWCCAMCQCDVVFESDDWREVSDRFNSGDF